MGKHIQHRPAKGFTIIEVVLVLAIAGLIFLVLFLALPALQRGQRDAQRRTDAAAIIAIVEGFPANSGGLGVCEAHFRGQATPIGATFAERAARVIHFSSCGPSQRDILKKDARFNVTSNAPWEAANANDTGYSDPRHGNQWLPVDNYAGSIAATNKTISVTIGAKCSASGSGAAADPVNSFKAYAVRVVLESGGFYCLDNS